MSPADSTSNVTSKRYHHGDLRTALIETARALLAAEQPFSLRAVAAAVGVSPAATYRHFSDRSGLEAAIAAQGYAELHDQLEAASKEITTATELWRLAVAYAHWAVANHTIFHLMCTAQFSPEAPEKTTTVAAIVDFLQEQLARWYPEQAGEAFFTGVWALTHGLTMLYLENKLDISDMAALEKRIQDVWATMFPA